MNDNSLRTRGLQQLRWKLTLNYTLVTVGAFLTVEILLLASLAVLLLTLINNGTLQREVIETASTSYAPTLRIFLEQDPPDRNGIAQLLETAAPVYGISLPLSFDANDEMFVIDSEGLLLAARPADLLGSSTGQPINISEVPGLDGPLQAALSGQRDTDQLYASTGRGEKIFLAVPVWDRQEQQVLGVLGAFAPAPTFRSLLSDTAPLVGFSFLLATLSAALIGTVYGFLAARGPVQRLNRLSEATQAWRRGDFSWRVDDPAADELGRLAQRLNEMALQLEQLLETRRELAVIEERNRLARELHDSVKQQAFAAAAQVSGVRRLLKRDPERAEEKLQDTERLLYELRQELSTLILELRPAALEGKGLAAALRQYAADWSHQNGISAEVHVQGERPLPLALEQPLFRIVQESLANVARHSQAAEVDISLRFVDGEVCVTIHDNGRGFNIQARHDGYGLRSMQERAAELSGKLTVESAGGQGTSIVCSVPIPEESITGDPT